MSSSEPTSGNLHVICHLGLTNNVQFAFYLLLFIPTQARKRQRTITFTVKFSPCTGSGSTLSLKHSRYFHCRLKRKYCHYSLLLNEIALEEIWRVKVACQQSTEWVGDPDTSFVRCNYRFECENPKPKFKSRRHEGSILIPR